MGLFDFLKREKDNDEAAPSMVLGMVLLKEVAPLNVGAVIKELRSKFRLAVDDPAPGEYSQVMQISGYDVALATMPVSIPGEEVSQAAGYNYFWENGIVEATAHRAHIIISILKAGRDPVAENILFSQVAAAVMNNSESIGIYIGGRSLVLRKDFYLENVAVMTPADLPLYIWIYFGMRTENGRQSVYTYGLADFGKKEMEMIQSTRDFEDLNGMMFNLAHYVIASNVTLRSGETIGMSAEQKLKITESKGRYLEGTTLKIDY